MIARRFKLRALPSPRALPQVDAPAHHAWREGWWQGLCVGIILGAALIVIALKS